jgi:hypothetical protein
MKIRNNIHNDICVIKGWNNLLNDKICLVIYEKKISYNERHNICKVLVNDKIYSVPKFFIKNVKKE